MGSCFLRAVLFDDSSSAGQPASDPFRARISVGSAEIGDEHFPTFKVEMSGVVNVPIDNCDCFLILHIVDVTDGTHKPVFLCH